MEAPKSFSLEELARSANANKEKFDNDIREMHINSIKRIEDNVMQIHKEMIEKVEQDYELKFIDMMEYYDKAFKRLELFFLVLLWVLFFLELAFKFY